MLKIPLAIHPGQGKLYRQLYEGLAGQIRAGALPTGTRLPGKRTLAEELSLSVNTVDTAYQMLAAEGYIESRPRSGFVVAAFAQPLRPAAHTPPPQAATEQRPRWRFDLTTGGQDTSLFPSRTWGRIQRELLYNAPELLCPGAAEGDWELRCALAEYLAAYRGVQCSPDQLVVGAGVEYLLGLVAQLLGGPAAAEDPCYPRAKMIFENTGLTCLGIPVDAGGLSVTALRRTDAALCYVTPSHQFPTGVTMPAPRRAALLQWAAEGPGRYIVEDDYDSEFRFDLKPLPSLQGMAGPDGRVIYLSTCSRSLAPGIRMAYMVLPRHLLPRWQQRYGLYSCTVGRYEQQTLACFIREGHFTRHLARLRNQYRLRRNALVEALQAAFGESGLQLQGLHTGLHLLLTLPGGPTEAEMLATARQAGIRLQGLSGYYHEKGSRCPPHTVVLGYGSLSPSDIPAVAAALKSCWSCTSVSSVNS